MRELRDRVEWPLFQGVCARLGSGDASRSLTRGCSPAPTLSLPCSPGAGHSLCETAVLGGTEPAVPATPPSHVPSPSCLLSPQPVPHSGSSGYGSLGSNGSHEPLMSQTSSSDSNGHKHSRRRRTVSPRPPCPSLSG